MHINKQPKQGLLFVTIIIAALTAMPIQADNWTLNKAQSTINFVSIKKETIAESHTFSIFSGNIKNNIATITINPASVDTNIAIRDERLSKFLFETNLFPKITINSNVETVLAKSNESTVTTIPATLSLHGVKKEVHLNIHPIKNDENTLTVISRTPVLIKASDYNLGGLSKLSSLAGGIPITKAVPVNFILVFNKSQ